MGIKYQCKHCGTDIGEIGFEHFETVQTGLQKFTKEEQESSVSHEEGNMQIQVVCDECQQALESNPQFYEYGHYIQ